MLAVVIVIAVAGIVLPAALWVVARWRKGKPAGPPRPSEVDAWLAREFDLGPNARSRVRKAVLGPGGTAPDGPKPASLPPEPACHQPSPRDTRSQRNWPRSTRVARARAGPSSGRVRRFRGRPPRHRLGG